jgi:hypothetical protein
MVDGETVVLAGHDEQEDKHGQTRNDVLVERIQNEPCKEKREGARPRFGKIHG